MMAVQFGTTTVPENHRAVRVAHQNGVMCQVQHRRLGLQFHLRLLLAADIGVQRNEIGGSLEADGRESDRRQKLAAILATVGHFTGPIVPGLQRGHHSFDEALVRSRF